jgi:short-subunit dehydrogenase
VLRADLTQKADLARVEQRLRSDARITMLVNNAGVAAGGPLVGGDLDRLEAMIDLHVVAVTRLASAAATNFATRGAGVLINLSSVLALAPEQFNAVYSGTKALCPAFLPDPPPGLSPSGVQVQVVLPGGGAHGPLGAHGHRVPACQRPCSWRWMQWSMPHSLAWTVAHS